MPVPLLEITQTEHTPILSIEINSLTPSRIKLGPLSWVARKLPTMPQFWTRWKTKAQNYKQHMNEVWPPVWFSG